MPSNTDSKMGRVLGVRRGGSNSLLPVGPTCVKCSQEPEGRKELDGDSELELVGSIKISDVFGCNSNFYPTGFKRSAWKVIRRLCSGAHSVQSEL